MRRAILVPAFVVLALCVLLAASAQAHPASGIVVDRKGQLFFSDLETVWKIDAGGRLTVFREGVRGRHVHELTIDAEDNIYGADVSYDSSTNPPRWISSVWKMTPAGVITYIVTPTDNPPRGASIWRDSQGNTYFVDQDNHKKRETLLIKRTPDGQAARFAGGAYGQMDGKGEQARFGSVGGMAWGPDGSLYLADGGSLRKVLMDGTVKTLARGLDVRGSGDDPLGYGSLFGLAVDADENVYVADFGNRRVLKVAADGKVSTLARPERPWSPTGIALAPGGNIYMLEPALSVVNGWSGPRVRKLSPDGKVSVVAVVGKGQIGEEKLSTMGYIVDKGFTEVWVNQVTIIAGLCFLALALFAWRLRWRLLKVR